jgi:hypothetical protein
MAQSCAQQVCRMRRILEELPLDIATPDKARAMPGLKGRDAVAFRFRIGRQNDENAAPTIRRTGRAI